MEELIQTLKDKLLELTNLPMDDTYFENAVEEIHRIMSSTECSLWSVNRNTTTDEEKKDKYDDLSISVICRQLDGEYQFKNREDYVHKLDTGLFRKVMETANRQAYYRCDFATAQNCNYRSMGLIKELELNDFISIPIPDKSDQDKIIAILDLSFKEKTINDEDCKKCARSIKTHFSTAFHRYLIYQKDKLQNVNGKFKGGDVKSFFDNLINKEFKSFFDYQGSSFFIWDSFSNVFRPIASTDETIAYNDPTKAYPKDGGRTHTGWVGTNGKPSISDEITDFLWYEQIEGAPQTSMIVPILDPANSENVIGIVRFLNKKNRKNTNVIDYFNDIDLNLIQQYAHYLSLIVYFYNKEQDQVNLISKVAHEFKTPANAIYKSATRLLDSIDEDDNESLQKNLEPYLENIEDFANIQRWQAETTLYSTRSQQQKTKYQVKKCSLMRILSRSRGVARPIARQEGVTLDNIRIFCLRSYENLHLNVDETAFVIVFYNLLTNAIKYHNTQDPDSFQVTIWYTISSVDNNDVKIYVQDKGLGIDKKDKEAIFQVGYRGERAMRGSSSGFGVGLSVVKQIITDFGGRIRVKSHQHPTTFEISLPKSLIV